MKRLVKWMGILLSVLFLSGSAWGYNYVDHVSTAPNGKGDLLFFKYYVVENGGWETKITVTNTNMAASVVAKVVIRSYKNSTELLDFLIYLSPADVWTARLYYDGTNTKIYSEDSSCLNQNGQWASATDPLDFALKTIGTAAMPFCPADSTKIGYLYVVQAAWSNASFTSGTSTINFGAPGVSKANIKTDYDKGANGHFTVYPAAGANLIPWNNSLAGYEVFQNATLGLFSSAVQAQALRNYKSRMYLALTQTNRLGATGEANNNLAEIEAALAKNYISLPFVESALAATVHILGFPTKYTKIISGGVSDICAVSNLSFDGPFFLGSGHVSSARVILYDVKVWDVNEVYSQTQIFSPSPTAGLRDEVNLIAVSAENADNFPEGWVSYPFASFTTASTNVATEVINYAGAPVLTATVFFGGGDAYAIDGAWSDGAITNGANVPLPGYHYSNTDGTN